MDPVHPTVLTKHVQSASDGFIETARRNFVQPSRRSCLAMRLIARGSLASENCSPCEPSCTTNRCLPTSIAAFTPPIVLLLRSSTGALTPPCVSIRARSCAAPSTVRALLRLFWARRILLTRGLIGLGEVELPRPSFSSSAASVADIQGEKGSPHFTPPPPTWRRGVCKPSGSDANLRQAFILLNPSPFKERSVS